MRDDAETASDDYMTRFGGWPDYREWARHDFHPRTEVRRSAAALASVPVVEIIAYVEEDVESMLVRPYVRARGRTAVEHKLEFETLLSSTGLHESWPGECELTENQVRICRTCDSPTSVAEIAAEIDVPIGAAQVLIDDAIDQGLLTVHDAAPVFQGKPTLELLRRIHAGVANIC